MLAENRTTGKGRLSIRGMAILAAGLAVAIGTALLLRQTWLQERERSLAGLSRFIVAPVEIGGRTYQISGGRVIVADGGSVQLFESLRALRLMRYALLSRVDPVFALSGADLDRLAAGIRALEESLDALAASSPPEERGRIRDLHPLRWLETLPELEAERRALIVSPSLARAQRYQARLSESIDLALEEVSRLAEHVRWASDGEAKRRGLAAGANLTVTFLRTSTDTETFLGALASIRQGFRQPQEKLKARSGCLSILRSCGGGLRFGWAVLLSTADGAAPHREALINPTVLSLLRTLWEREGYRTSPKVVMAATPCFGDQERVHPVQLTWKPKGQINRSIPQWEALGLGDVLEPQLLDAMYFINIEGSPRARQAYRPLADQEFPLFWHIATHLYTCPDLGYLPRIAGLNRLVEELEAEPLLRSTPAPASSELTVQIEAVRQAEQRLIASDVFYEDDTRSFVGRLGELLTAHGEAAVAAAIGEEATLRAGELVAQFFQSSAGFDELVAAGAFRNYRLPQWSAVTAGQNPAAAYLFMISSAPSLFFLPFNYTFGDGLAPSQWFAAAPGGRAGADAEYIELGGLERRYPLAELERIMARSQARFDAAPAP